MYNFRDHLLDFFLELLLQEMFVAARASVKEMSYCGWTQYCTIWWAVCSSFHRVSSISVRAGFGPSTGLKDL